MGRDTCPFLSRDFSNSEAPGTEGEVVCGCVLGPFFTSSDFFPFSSEFGWRCRKKGRGQGKKAKQGRTVPYHSWKATEVCFFQVCHAVYFSSSSNPQATSATKIYSFLKILIMWEREWEYVSREWQKRTSHQAGSLMWGLIPGPLDRDLSQGRPLTNWAPRHLLQKPFLGQPLQLMHKHVWITACLRS